LQTGLKAVADVRIVGTHTLTSRILDYRIADEVASARPGIRRSYHFAEAEKANPRR